MTESTLNNSVNDSTHEFSDLQKRFDLLQKELSLKTKELWDYDNQYSAVKEREAYYLHELDGLKLRETSEIMDLEQKIKHLNTLLHDEYLSECTGLDEKVAIYQDELTSLEKTKTELLLNETMEEIFVDESLIALKNRLQDELTDQIMERDSLQIHNTHLRNEHSIIQTELAQIRDKCSYTSEEILEAQSLLNDLEEELLLITNELTCAKTASLQQTNDSDSLFAEVNDRRVELQKDIENMKRKYCDIKNEVTSKQRELSNLKFIKEELMNFKKSYQDVCDESALTLKNVYLSRITTLEYIYEGFKKDLLQKQDLTNNGLPYDTLGFLDRLDEEKRKTNTEIENEKGTQFRAQKMMHLKRREVQLKIEEVKQNIITRLQPKLAELENTIVVLRNQCNSHEKENTVDENKTSEAVPQYCIASENKQDQNTEQQPVLKSKPANRKVAFTEDTAQPKGNVFKRGGKTIQMKSVHIPKLIKK